MKLGETMKAALWTTACLLLAASVKRRSPCRRDSWTIAQRPAAAARAWCQAPT